MEPQLAQTYMPWQSSSQQLEAALVAQDECSCLAGCALGGWALRRPCTWYAHLGSMGVKRKWLRGLTTTTS